MIIIGITGSIGMGKSTVSGMLRDMGIPVHDMDASVHKLIGPKGAAVSTIAKKFPEALKKNADGEDYMDRAILGRIVFTDRQKKKELEDLMAPFIWSESDRFFEELKQKNCPVAVLDAPLLFESGEEKRVDVIICVSASKDKQQQRVLARPGMTLERFNQVVAGQLPDAEKRKRSDYVIDTNKDIADTRAQLSLVLAEILPPSCLPSTKPKAP